MGERRRYFKVADSIAHEPWTETQLATAIRLMGHMHERWARDGLTPEEAATVILGRTDLLRVTGKDVLHEAVDALLAVAQVVTLQVSINDTPIPIPQRIGDETGTYRQRILNETITNRPRNWYKFATIRWPKFPIFQGLPCRDRDQVGTNRVPPNPKTKPETKTEEEKTLRPKKNGRVGMETWMTPFAQIWEQEVGAFAFAKCSAPLRSVVSAIGQDEAVSKFRLYCRDAEDKTKLSAQRFAETYRAIGNGISRRGHSTSHDNQDAIHRFLDKLPKEHA